MPSTRPPRALPDEVRQAVTDIARAKRMLIEARRRLGRLTRPGMPHHLVEKNWQWAHDLMECRCERLLGLPNVVGYGLGFRIRKGERTGTPALVVYVSKKRPPSRLRSGGMLPKTVSVGKRRLPIDVVELGGIERQIAPGDSIGPDPLFEKGTLGAFARDTSQGDIVALTAMHVTPLQEFPAQGAQCNFQSPCPGTDFGTLRAGSMTGIDAAKVALASQPAPGANALPEIGQIRGWRPTTFPGDQNATVRMFGATSKFQMGTIASTATSIPSESLTAAILVNISTQGGDSGCALVDSENLVLGFLVGRADASLGNMAVFTPASLVLSRLGCDIPSA